MKGLINKHPFIVTASSGILAGGVYSFGLPALLLPVFLALFFFVVSSQKKPSSLFHIIKLTAAFYYSFYFVVLIWFLDTDVTLLAGLSGEYARLFLGLCLVIMAFVITLASTPLAVVLHKIQDRLSQPHIGTLAVVASAWVVIEWCRSIVFSIFLYAPGASIGDYWNFGSLGLAVISSPIGYVGRFFGMYGLSMLVVLVSVTIVWALHGKFKPIILIVCGLIVLGSVGYFYELRSEIGSSVPASVLQREGNLDDLTSGPTDFKFMEDSPKELIVLTEYSRIHADGNEKYAQKYVFDRLSPSGMSIDVLADFTKPGVRYNTLEARNKNSEVLDTQTKQLLIPTGEYLPGILQLFYKLTGQDGINQNFAATRGLNRGQPPRVVSTGSLHVAPVACSGILGRNIYRDLVNDGGQVLTNSASLIIFSGSKAYFRQSLQMARFHAIANQRTYIQASMGAPAFVIDDQGDFIVAPAETKTAFIDFRFTPTSHLTPYTRFGEWPLLLATAVNIGFVGHWGWKHLGSRRKS